MFDNARVYVIALLIGPLAGCVESAPAQTASSGARGTSAPSVDRGREVFRFETFGNEGFWTDAARVPQGVQAAHVTPLKALEIGLSFDVDALDAATRSAIAEQLRADPTGRTSALLNDPGMMMKMVNANALIGIPIKANAKVGVSCALCHTVTDGSLFNMPAGGSIGHRKDGLTNHNLNVGAVLATAANSRALFPVLQLALKANGGKTLGRAAEGLTSSSSEAEVDAYLKNPESYPVGMFDDSFDGNGDPMHITPLFRQDLAAPFGSEGAIAKLANFSNLVYTALFDPTNLTTPGGRAFLHKLGGAAGDEIADEYVKVLSATGVSGYPFVRAARDPRGGEEAPIGLRVDNQKLQDLNAFMMQLPAPRGAPISAQAAMRGRQLFRTAGCISCHNADQSAPVRAAVLPMKRIFPGDAPVILAQRLPPLNPVQDTPNNPFDDKMAVVNASMRGSIRGIALPLLLDLARKPVFLHDNSVPSLDLLFDPARGASAPHPFFISDAKQRHMLIDYLRSFETGRGRPKR